MNRNKIYSTVFLIAFIMLCRGAFSQTSTSPYSSIGIGDIQRNYFDRSTGMGNSGISLYSNRYIYDANPASLTALDDHFFTMELAGNYSAVQYKGNMLSNTPTSNQMQVQRFTMAVKAKPFWGLSFGLKQFSASNYSFYGGKNIVGTMQNVQAYYDGSGGINQVFFSNAFQLWKNLSIGVNASYLFGSMQNVESLLPQDIISSQLNTTNQLYYKHLYFEGGMQYRAKLSSKLKLSLGAIASNKTTLTGSRYLSLTQGDPNAGLPTPIITDSVVGSTRFNLPVMYGGGISLNYKDALTIAGDYKSQRWSNVSNLNGGFGYSFQNSDQYSGGIEYTKKKTVIINNRMYQLEKYYFQLGGFYNREYLRINGQQLTDKGITFGIGINSLKTQLGYMFSAQIGSRGTTANNLIKENYFQLGVGVTFRDLWLKRKMY